VDIISFIRVRIGSALHRSIDYFAYRDNKFSLILVFLFSLVRNSYKQIKLLPIEWLDENETNLRKTLETEEYGESYGPHINGSQAMEKVLLPAIKVYCFKNASVSATSSSILTDNKIIIERAEAVDVQRCDFASGHIFMHGQKSALVINRPASYLDQGIFLGGNGSWNYYHWMVEILPKLKYLQYLEEDYHDFPLLVSDDVDYIKTFREALDCIIKGRSIIKLDKNKTYLVGKLLYINAPNFLPFNFRHNEKMKISDFLIRTSSINFLRNSLSTNFRNIPHVGIKKRLFFARQKEGREYNQEETYDLFRRHGFYKVFMEELSLRNQIELVSNAEIIAGPTGAAWTNLIFCREKTKCLCWMADGYGDFSAFSNLAKIVGVDLRYITYKKEAKSIQELNSLGYHIDAREIQKGLDALLNTAA
jgi:capsular polysaccharide biosynthesis protein